ncbi:MAG: class I SAM-dependent methyltransferase, partial [Vampirovibrionia bacterium]
MIDPQLFLQLDMDTPLRLSPKVFISKNDENYFTIGLYDKDNARKYLKHFLTVVYSFCDYVSLVELMTMWPQDTVNDLLKVIITLKKEQILLDQETYDSVNNQLTTEFLLEEKQLINDKNWLEPFYEAVKTIKDGSNVLNLGAKGAGVIARELAKQNINKVVALTGDYQAAMLGRKRVKEANLTNIEFVSCETAKLSSICFAEQFDYILLELFHNGIFEDRVLESVLYAKKNLLSSECEFMPAKMNLKVFAYDSPYHRDMVQESKEFDILYGFNFAPFTEAMSKHIMGIYTRLSPDITTKISEDYTIK